MSYYIEFWKRCFDYKGVTSRKQYWLTLLMNCVIILVLFLAAAALETEVDFSFSESSFFIYLTLILDLAAMLYLFASMLCSIALSVRRLHDTNKSGLVLLLSLIPPGSIVVLILLLMGSAYEDNPYRVNDIRIGYSDRLKF